MELVAFLLLFLGYFRVYNSWPNLLPVFYPFFLTTSIISLLYLFAICGILDIGAFTIYGISCIALLFLRRSDFQALCRSPPLCLYLLSSIALHFFLYDLEYLHLDEFSHWGLASKEMLRTHGLPRSDSNILFINYPPGTALFHYFFLFINDAHHEGITYWAHSLLLLSPVSVLCYRLTWKNWMLVLTIFTSIIYILHAFGLGFENLQVDHLLSTLYGCGASAGFTFLRGPKRKFCLIPILIALCLIKESGQLLALSLCLISLGDLCLDLYRRHHHLKGLCANARSQILKTLTCFGMMILSCGFVITTWNWHIISLNLYDIFKLDSPTKKDVIRLVSGNFTQEEKKILADFKFEFIQGGISVRRPQSWYVNLISTAIPTAKKAELPDITEIQLIIMLTLSFVGLMLNSRNKWQRRRMGIYIIGMIACLVFFIIGLVSAYLFTIHSVASFLRYMNVQNAALLMFIIGSLNPQILPNRRPKLTGYFSATVLFLMLFLYTPPFMFLERDQFKLRNQKIRQALTDYVDWINRFVQPTDSVYIIYQTLWEFEYHYVTYKLSPVKTNRWCGGTPNQKWHWSLSTDGVEIDTIKVGVREWSQHLRNHFDYVFIGWRNEQFLQQYGALFRTDEEARKWVLYRVDKNNKEMVRLIPCH